MIILTYVFVFRNTAPQLGHCIAGTLLDNIPVTCHRLKSPQRTCHSPPSNTPANFPRRIAYNNVRRRKPKYSANALSDNKEPSAKRNSSKLFSVLSMNHHRELDQYADDFVAWCEDNGTCAIAVLRDSQSTSVSIVYPTNIHPHEVIGMLTHAIRIILQHEEGDPDDDSEHEYEHG